MKSNRMRTSNVIKRIYMIYGTRTVATAAVFASSCTTITHRNHHHFCNNIFVYFSSFFSTADCLFDTRAHVCVCVCRRQCAVIANSDEGDTSSSSSSENEGKISYRDYEGPCCQPLLIVPPSSPVLPDKMNANKKVNVAPVGVPARCTRRA